MEVPPPLVTPTTGLAAVAYCEAGFEIIPLWPGSKSPSIPSPHEWGSPERGVCKGECGQPGHGLPRRQLRRRVGRRALDGSARTTGSVSGRESEEVVLDIDVRYGGDVELAALEAQARPAARDR